jgi:large subunit ribosomal protein L11
MPGKEVIDLLVEGGKAGPNPSTAQKLSALKMNIGDVFKKINDETVGYKGMQVPVKLIIDKDTKEVEVEVGIPPVSSMVKKELGIEKAKFSEEDVVAGKTVLGSVTMEQVVKIAKLKVGEMLVKDLKSAVKQVVGTVGSMTGVQIEEKDPKEVLKDIDEGKWDKLFNQ